MKIISIILFLLISEGVLGQSFSAYTQNGVSSYIVVNKPKPASTGNPNFRGFWYYVPAYTNSTGILYTSSINRKMSFDASISYSIRHIKSRSGILLYDRPYKEKGAKIVSGEESSNTYRFHNVLSTVGVRYNRHNLILGIYVNKWVYSTVHGWSKEYRKEKLILNREESPEINSGDIRFLGLKKNSFLEKILWMRKYRGVYVTNLFDMGLLLSKEFQLTNRVSASLNYKQGLFHVLYDPKYSGNNTQPATVTKLFNYQVTVGINYRFYSR